MHDTFSIRLNDNYIFSYRILLSRTIKSYKYTCSQIFILKMWRTHTNFLSPLPPPPSHLTWRYLLLHILFHGIPSNHGIFCLQFNHSLTDGHTLFPFLSLSKNTIYIDKHIILSTGTLLFSQGQIPRSEIPGLKGMCILNVKSHTLHMSNSSV